MSEYVQVDLEMTDGDCIEAALKDMGFTCEVHNEAQSLVGFQGDRRSQMANIIVRRSVIGGASNDLGFLKKANGNYEMIISEYDKRTGNGKKIMNEIKQQYGKQKFLKQVKKMGFMVKSQKVDEKGRVKIRVMGGA